MSFVGVDELEAESVVVVFVLDVVGEVVVAFSWSAATEPERAMLASSVIKIIFLIFIL